MQPIPDKSKSWNLADEYIKKLVEPVMQPIQDFSVELDILVAEEM